jgi:hypothetical protein
MHLREMHAALPQMKPKARSRGTALIRVAQSGAAALSSLGKVQAAPKLALGAFKSQPTDQNRSRLSRSITLPGLMQFQPTDPGTFTIRC